MENSTKVWAFQILSSILLCLIGFSIAERSGLLLCFFISVLFNIILYFFGRDQVLNLLQAKQIRGQDPDKILITTDHWSRLAGIPTPDVFFVESDRAFIFSLQHAFDPGVICISKGTLDALSSRELEAMIAHQVCHLRRLGGFWVIIGSSLANAFLGFGYYVDQILPKKFRIISNLMQPLAWAWLRITHPSSTFYSIDDFAANLLHERQSLAEAIWKLYGASLTKPSPAPLCTAHLFAVAPAARGWTHPQIEERMRRLIGYFPI